MLVGICGNSRVGKDTAANVLVENFGYTKYHLAQTMKDCLKLIFGWDDDYIENRKEEEDPEYGISPRQVLRAFGTEFAQRTLCEMYPKFDRVVGRKLWVNSLFKHIPEGQNAVIADVRFQHEALEIKKKGGLILKIDRPGYPVDISHASEREIAGIESDFFINNAGSLQEHQASVFEWADWFLTREDM